MAIPRCISSWTESRNSFATRYIQNCKLIPVSRSWISKPTISFLFRSSSHQAKREWNKYEEFFNFTRARFVRDEAGEMARRRVKFDMNELARIAAKTVGSEHCVNVQKYPDGMYSKAFLMTMDDGKEVVAKVPNPNAGLAHYTTASEVATMHFVSPLLPSYRISVLDSDAVGLGAQCLWNTCT